MTKILISLLLLIGSNGFAQRRIEVTVNSSQPLELIAAAGVDLISSGTDVTLGGNPSALGGSEPYTYQWLPDVNLNSATNENPIYTGIVSQEFILIVTDNRGCTASDTISIEISNDIQGHSQENELSIYPNPGVGMVRLNVKSNFTNVGNSIYLSDANGNRILTEYVPNWNEDFLLDVSTLAQGTYYVTIGEGERIVTKKLTITKK